MHGRFAVVTMEECVHEIDMLTSATGNFNSTTFEHMKTMKNNASVTQSELCRDARRVCRYDHGGDKLILPFDS